VRRSYSICSNANTGKLRVGIKRLPGGVFSNWAIERLEAGDVVEVMPPVGEFIIEPDREAARHRVAIAAGSGITPVLSLISTTLESEPLSTWTLVYGNRSANTVMFLEELEGLKDRYPERFQLLHVLSREGSDLPLLSGRIDDAKIRIVHEQLLAGREVDDWYLCGPYDMVMTARATLSGLGVEEARMHDELFFAGPLDEASLPPEPPPGEGTVNLTVILDGRAVETRMDPETSILDAALRVRSELPFSCKGGMCASCKGRIEEGEVSMDKNYALVDTELQAGYVLTCQSHPLTDRVVVRYDHR
jgi:ring-1,2-phenylacetyl-CoA epoxidase subunit PaaE